MKCIECPEYQKCCVKNDLRRKRPRCPKAKEKRNYSNADRIRAMTDEELVEFLWKLDSADLVDVVRFCCSSVCDELSPEEITDGMCKRCLLAKLQAPDESTNGKKG